MADYGKQDDFWDLSKLVPKKKPVRTFSSEIKTVEYNLPNAGDGNNQSGVSAERKLSFSDMRSSSERIPDDTYEPTSVPFIKRVTIKRTLDRFDFYGNFRKAALVYFDYKTHKCDFAPFYSYTPQYSQLTVEQKNYYFYWREEVRRGNYIRSDYSYVTLYAYEILNLPDLIPPKEGLRILALLWKNYRLDLPRLDASFAVWVQDYCLVHKLDCPIDIIGDFMHGIIELSGFPEFYLSSLSRLSTDGVGVLVSYLSDYDWRRSRYALSDEGEFYKKHMLRAMSRLVSAMQAEADFINRSDEVKVITRSAFQKSLLTHSVKCTLVIEYYAVLSSPELRASITNAVRYTENKLRCALGVKSRLSVKEIDGYHKYVIDKYFEGIIAAECEKRRLASIPEYEKLYDAPHVDLSVSGADEIEKASWLITERLVADEEIEDAAPPTAAPPSANILENSEEPEKSIAPTASDDAAFLRAVMAGNAVQSAENDMAAERINERSIEVIGDIIIEILGDAYALVEDYREDAERLL